MNQVLLAELQIIKKNGCIAHRKHSHYFCKTDLKEVCSDCVLFGEHKGHDVVQQKELSVINTQLVSQLKIDLLSFKLGEGLEQHQSFHGHLSQRIKNDFTDLRKTFEQQMEVN